MKHQIDVYWKFDIANVTYQAAVQAKDWASRVTKEKVLAFKAVLDDLPGQPRGIMITKVGYQSGAELFAREHGIELYLFHEVSDEAHDLVSKIPGAHFSTHFENIEMHYDPDWLEKNELIVRRFFESTDPARCWIYSMDGRKIKSFVNVLENIRNITISTGRKGAVFHAFDEPVDVREDNGSLSIRVIGVSATFVLTNRRESELTVDVSRLFSTVIRQVTGNKEFYVDHENRLHEKSLALCDFCGVPVPDDDSNLFKTSRVAMVMKAGANDAGPPQVWEEGYWGGCDRCAELIRQENREDLFRRARSLMARLYPGRSLAGLMAAHNAFWYGYAKLEPMKYSKDLLL